MSDLNFSVPSQGRAGVGAIGASIGRPACPHPGLPPEEEGANTNAKT